MRFFGLLLLVFSFSAQANQHNYLVHMTCKDFAGIPRSTSGTGLAFVYNDPSNLNSGRDGNYSAAFSDIHVRQIQINDVASDIRDQYRDCQKIYHFKNGRFFVQGTRRTETSCIGRVSGSTDINHRREPTNNDFIALLKQHNQKYRSISNKCFYFEGFNKNPLPQDLSSLTDRQVMGLPPLAPSRPATLQETTRP